MRCGGLHSRQRNRVCVAAITRSFRPLVWRGQWGEAPAVARVSGQAWPDRRCLVAHRATTAILVEWAECSRARHDRGKPGQGEEHSKQHAKHVRILTKQLHCCVEQKNSPVRHHPDGAAALRPRRYLRTARRAVSRKLSMSRCASLLCVIKSMSFQISMVGPWRSQTSSGNRS